LGEAGYRGLRTDECRSVLALPPVDEFCSIGSLPGGADLVDDPVNSMDHRGNRVSLSPKATGQTADGAAVHSNHVAHVTTP
jgi:hypothetical protein